MSNVTGLTLGTQPTFPPMYYDSPATQTVLEFAVTAADSLMAAITAGATYFKVVSLASFKLEETPILPPPPTLPGGVRPQAVSDAAGKTSLVQVASSNGTTPLSVMSGQTVRLTLTAEVPKGTSLAPGKFTGAATVTGKTTKEAVNLAGTYLGTLMGKVTVTPATVVPGQSVQVQVLDASGKVVSDPTVTVLIQGTAATSRYYQFAAVGTYPFYVVASRGALTETTSVNVVVAGNAMAFRASLAVPVVTEVPMLQVSAVMGQPYAAMFTLGNTPGVRRSLAAAVAQKAAAAPSSSTTTAAAAAPAVASVAAAPTDALGVEVTKVLASLPAAQVTRIAPVSTKASSGIFTASATLAPVGGLTTQAEATSYNWNFGDGTTATTQAPTVTHDFFPAIRAGDVTRPFDVSCTVVHDKITVTRTLVLHSSYGICKRLGAIVPPVTGDVYATFQQLAFSATIIVTNLEASAITLSSMAVVPITDDASVAPPAPSFTAMKTPVVIAANSSSAIGVYVPTSQLQLSGAFTNGFTLHYKGSMGETPVRFSYTLRVPLSDSGMTNVSFGETMSPAHWNLTSALSAVTSSVTQSSNPVSKAGAQTVDTATNTVAIALTSNARDPSTLTQVRSAVQAGLTDIARKTGALTLTGSSLKLATLPKTAGKAVAALPRAVASGSTPKLISSGTKVVALDYTYDPLSAPPVAAGAQCYPDDISDQDAATAAAQQLVCQLTTNTQTVTLPSSFQNAQQGDVILSPAPVGSGDLIAAMFAALVPPQHHGHSGIMTANYIEITHCTASVDYVKADMNTEGAAGINVPTSLNGQRLQYAWPGALVQSIDDATHTTYIADPNAPSGTKPYSFNSFNVDSLGDGFELIYPVVVKPLPENEAIARPILRKAADLARSKAATYVADGSQYDANVGASLTGGSCYYSFYCYTDPQISAGFSDVAAAGAGVGGWAAGRSPAVCASFVWMSLKATETATGTPIPLVSMTATEILSDFPVTAIAAGVQVGPTTLDGLFYYPQSERQLAAQALYNEFMQQAISQEDGLGTFPGVNSTIAGPIADQLLNAFASGNPNLVGSKAWQDPGDGNAVSPDNIMFWNPPYYGSAEPLQYLPQHTEQYTTSEWVKVITWGSVTGKVTYNGAPVPNATVSIYNYGDGTTTTGPDGTYTLSHIGIGSYGIKASATITTNGVTAEYTNYNQQNASGQAVTLTAANPNVVQNIELLTNPIVYRQLNIQYSMSCDHGDGNPFNKHGVLNAGPYTQSAYVNPGQTTSSLWYDYDYNGGGYFNVSYNISVALLFDLSLQVSVAGTMVDDGSGTVQAQYTLGPINVPVGGSWSGSMWIEQSGSGYHNGPATLTFTLQNVQQTG